MSWPKTETALKLYNGFLWQKRYNSMAGFVLDIDIIFIYFFIFMFFFYYSIMYDVKIFNSLSFMSLKLTLTKKVDLRNETKSNN